MVKIQINYIKQKSLLPNNNIPIDRLIAVATITAPAILIVSQRNNLDRIKSILSDTRVDLNVKTDISTVKVEEHGAQILESTVV